MSDPLHQVLLLFGMAMFFGLSGGKLFRHLKIPQVVGYIIIGLIFGVSGFGLFDKDAIKELGPFTNFALGIIGFMIGGEIQLSTFKKYGKSILSILLCEGILAYILVGLATYVVTRNFAISILLGALASATAPAATVDVIWEYRAKGILSTTILAIVALDDGLSLILYAVSKVFAESSITGKTFSIVHSLAHPLLELISALGLGIVSGLTVILILRWIHEVKEKESFLVISLGVVLITTGIAAIFNLDLILCNMALGTTLANANPKRSHFLFSVTKQIVAPIYVVFFVLVGARLQLSTFASFGIIGVVYVLARTAGKMSGSYLGALISKADVRVRNYLGTSLFSQAGVAIGLAIAIYHSFSEFGPEGQRIGLLILNVITATTFIVQIIGPSSVKWSLKKADEIGKAMSEEEILNEYQVFEIMAKSPTAIREDETYNEVMKKIKHSDFVYFPVVDKHKKLRGIIQLDHVRSILFEEHLGSIVNAMDIAVQDVATISPEDKLTKANELFDFEEFDYLPVVDERNVLKGVLPRRSLKKFIKRKLWEGEVV